MTKILFRSIILYILFFSASHAANLTQGGVLSIGDHLYSDSGKYFVSMQSDGNLVVYRTQDMKALWSTQTSGKGGQFIQMQYDGNLVMYDSSNQAIWNSQTGGRGPAFFTISEFGQALVLGSTSTWQSNTSDGTHSIDAAPAVFAGGTRTAMDGSSYFQNNGRYRLAFQTDGNLVLYKDGVVAFRTNTPNKGVTHALISNSMLVMMQRDDRQFFATPRPARSDLLGNYGYLSFQPDGNLVIYAPLVLWAASSDDAPEPVHGLDPRCPVFSEACFGGTWKFPIFTW